MSTDLRLTLNDRQKQTVRWLAFKIGGRFDGRAFIEQSGLSQSEYEHLCHVLEQQGGLRITPDPTRVTSGHIEILPGIKELAEQLDGSNQPVPKPQPLPDATPAMSETAKPITHVVLLVHGIRDYGPWQQRVINGLSADGIAVIGCKFGFYNSLRFLAPWDMSKPPIERVHREIRNIKRAYPNARISVIAHSFGTHVLTKILQDDPDLLLWRVLLCGSVVKQGFKWDTVIEKIGDAGDPDKRKYIVNDCGDADRWPVLGASAGWRYGSAGVDGFGSTYVTDRFHTGDHGLFFDPKFIETNWKPFIHDGHIVPGTADQRGKLPWYIYWLGLAPLRWIIPPLLIVVAAILIGLLVLLGIGAKWAYAKWTAPPVSQVQIDDFTARLKQAREKGAAAKSNFNERFVGTQVNWRCVVRSVDSENKAYYVAADETQPPGTQAMAFLDDPAQFDPTMLPGTKVNVQGTIQRVSDLGVILQDCTVTIAK